MPSMKLNCSCRPCRRVANFLHAMLMKNSVVRTRVRVVDLVGSYLIGGDSYKLHEHEYLTAYQYKRLFAQTQLLQPTRVCDQRGFATNGSPQQLTYVKQNGCTSNLLALCAMQNYARQLQPETTLFLFEIAG